MGLWRVLKGDRALPGRNEATKFQIPLLTEVSEFAKNLHLGVMD